MTTKKFSKGEALRFGWDVMKNNRDFFIGFLILCFAVLILPTIFSRLVEGAGIDPFFMVIFWIADMFLRVLVSMGLTKTALRFCDNETGKMGDVFSQYLLFFAYLIAMILYYLVVFGGYVLLIVPGIIFGIRFIFYGHFVIDQKLGPIAALKKSFAITKGATWELLLFFLLTWGINLLGLLCVVIGLFATLPTTMVAWAFVYRKLLSQAEDSKQIESPYGA